MKNGYIIFLLHNLDRLLRSDSRNR